MRRDRALRSDRGSTGTSERLWIMMLVCLRRGRTDEIDGKARGQSLPGKAALPETLRC